MRDSVDRAGSPNVSSGRPHRDPASNSPPEID
jgi:hypothetical protein